MSDEPTKPPAEAAHPAAKPPKLVVILLGVNLALSGLGAFKLMTAKPAAAAGEAHEAREEHKPTNEITGPVVALDPFVVNLDEPGQSRYLKVTFQLELDSADAEGALTKSKQLVRDTILSYLSGLRLADTLGTEAKERIREDLVAKLEKVVGTHKVRRMFFQEFVVQ